MAQCSVPLAALAEGPGWIPSPHTAALNHFFTPFPGDPAPTSGLQEYFPHVVLLHTHLLNSRKALL